MSTSSSTNMSTTPKDKDKEQGATPPPPAEPPASYESPPFDMPPQPPQPEKQPNPLFRTEYPPQDQTEDKYDQQGRIDQLTAKLTANLAEINEREAIVAAQIEKDKVSVVSDAEETVKQALSVFFAPPMQQTLPPPIKVIKEQTPFITINSTIINHEDNEEIYNELLEQQYQDYDKPELSSNRRGLPPLDETTTDILTEKNLIVPKYVKSPNVKNKQKWKLFTHRSSYKIKIVLIVIGGFISFALVILLAWAIWKYYQLRAIKKGIE